MHGHLPGRTGLSVLLGVELELLHDPMHACALQAHPVHVCLPCAHGHLQGCIEEGDERADVERGSIASLVRGGFVCIACLSTSLWLHRTSASFVMLPQLRFKRSIRNWLRCYLQGGRKKGASTACCVT